MSKVPIQTGSDGLSQVFPASNTEVAIWFAAQVVTESLRPTRVLGTAKLPPASPVPTVRVTDDDRVIITGTVKEDPTERGTGAEGAGADDPAECGAGTVAEPD